MRRVRRRGWSGWRRGGAAGAAAASALLSTLRTDLGKDVSGHMARRRPDGLGGTLAELEDAAASKRQIALHAREVSIDEQRRAEQAIARANADENIAENDMRHAKQLQAQASRELAKLQQDEERLKSDLIAEQQLERSAAAPTNDKVMGHILSTVWTLLKRAPLGSQSGN